LLAAALLATLARLLLLLAGTLPAAALLATALLTALPGLLLLLARARVVLLLVRVLIRHLCTPRGIVGLYGPNHVNSGNLEEFR
jgi:hypothetical protein